MKLKNKQLIV